MIWEAELDTSQPLSDCGERYGEGSGVSPEATTTWAWVAGVTWTVWALSRPTIPACRVYARGLVERLTTFWGVGRSQ